MTIVLPIVLGAVFVGLFVKRVTPRTWWFLGLWITIVVVYHLLKHKP